MKIHRVLPRRGKEEGEGENGTFIRSSAVSHVCN